MTSLLRASAVRKRHERDAGAQRRTGLFGQRDGSEQLIAPHLGTRLGDQHVAAQASLVVFDIDRDLLAWQPERVNAPPDPTPADIPIPVDGRARAVRSRCLAPAVAQSEA